MILKNDRLIRALLRQPVDQTPVWLMRQAGRYLPEYRELRRQAPNFMQFCQTPELAVKATLQPLERFSLDAAIIFSDILTVPAAMGVELEFIEGRGPVINNPISSSYHVNQLNRPDVTDELGYVMTAIRAAVKLLQGSVPLIGFAGSPWTCACYMVEGQGSKTFSKVKALAYSDPVALHTLLQRLADVTIDYLNAQIEAGANALMVFDTWGGVLAALEYQAFSLHYLTQIAAGVKRVYQGQAIPLIFFTKGGGQWLEGIAASGCDAVGLDWTTDLNTARQLVGARVALQGNLDPCVLYAKPAVIERKVEALLNNFGAHPGHVFNLGHGIYPDIPPENVRVLVDCVHQYSAALFAKCEII